MNRNFQQICEDFLPEVQETGSYIRTKFKEREKINFQTKGANELVSLVDREAEKKLVEKAQTLLPQATFLTEEQTIQSGEGEYQWIIDPLDGTTNFYYGIPVFSISVALVYRGEIVMGIVYDVIQDDLFYAWENGGCHLNGAACGCSDVQETKEVFLATGIPNYTYAYIQEYLQNLDDLIHNTRGIRRLGSAALELAYVAVGRFDAFFESGLKPWDIAASICLIREGGGTISDLYGGDNYLHGQSILAAGKQIHPQLLEKVKKQ